MTPGVANILPAVDQSGEINRASWDERARAGYARQHFIDDPSFLSAVIHWCSFVRVLGRCGSGHRFAGVTRLGLKKTSADDGPIW